MPGRELAVVLALTVALPVTGGAQARALRRADSTLVRRILVAEEARDSTDAALRDGSAHRDARIRLIAARALARIRDPQFRARDSVSGLGVPLVTRTRWADPAWRLRYRRLASQRDSCDALRSAFADSVWHVRLRAADLAGVSCGGDDTLVAVLRGWIAALPADASRHDRGGVSWHAAAHAIVALARLRPDEARARVPALARHDRWEVRMYTARAAALLSDTALLRVLAGDSDDNVKEAAIDALSRLTGHADDEIFVAALGASGAQAVRAAANALRGSPRPDVVPAANAAFERWVARASASERDARIALLEAAGRPASDDRPPAGRTPLPGDVVPLALGREVQLRVRMAAASGGGTFALRLRGDAAPIMAARVLQLVRRGYYDGGTWHRVEPDFVIQGAGPGTNEYVGFDQYLRDELGTLAHLRGTVGMSTRGHDTGDAQWFINLKDNLRLNRDYTVFAEVVDGIEVADDIMEGDRIARIDVLPQ